MPSIADIQATQLAGATRARLKSAATVNNTLVKAGLVYLNGILVSNNNAAARYLKLFNKATEPVAGTDTPYFTFLIPATSVQYVPFDVPVAFPLGLGYALTTGVADNDTAAVAADEIQGALFYTF